MISDFLRKQKNTLLEKQAAMEEQVAFLKTEKLQTEKFISILDERRDKLLHTVSPNHPVDEDEKKIRELKRKLHVTEEELEQLTTELTSLTRLLEEYDEHIDDAFDLEFMKGQFDQLEVEKMDQKEKEDFNYHLLSEQEQEKTNAARELFDSFSPLFTIATHRLDIAQKFMDVDPERSKREIVDVSGTMENCISEMNRLLSMISPIDFQKKSLRDALELELARMRETFGVKINLEYKIDKQLTSKLVCSSIFQMVQEVCSFMIMEEKPGLIEVSLTAQRRNEMEQVRIYITGYKGKHSRPVSDEAEQRELYRKNLCLVKEKVYLLAGDLEIKSRHSGETAIVICVPYKD